MSAYLYKQDRYSIRGAVKNELNAGVSALL